MSTATTQPETTTQWVLPGCVQCDASERSLTKAGIPHTIRDLSEHPEQLERFRAAGHLRAPIIVPALGEPWSGFNPGRIAELAVALAAEAENDTYANCTREKAAA